MIAFSISAAIFQLSVPEHDMSAAAHRNNIGRIYLLISVFYLPLLSKAAVTGQGKRHLKQSLPGSLNLTLKKNQIIISGY